jgi:succinate dehydrogenase / fumarate reductase, cytochrome b subunit
MVRNFRKNGRSISTRPRPLSPHLGIYKAQYSSRLSISHRVSGCALAFVLLLRCTTLNRASLCTSFLGGIVDSSWFRGLAGIIPSLRNGVRLCRILSLVYHRVNGCRHLVWDSGKLLDKATRNRSSLTVRAVSVGISCAIFFGWVA